MRLYSITPSSICSYYRPNFVESIINSKISGPRKEIQKTHNEKSMENLKIKRNKNELSRSAVGRLKKAVNWLVFLSEEREIRRDGKLKLAKFRTGFITLKLPSKQVHTHSEITKRSLNNFLTLLRTQCNVKNYVWRAELQKNGNLHYHILIDRYVHHRVVRDFWNQSIEILGYVRNYKEKFSKLSFSEYLKLRNDQGSTDYKKIKSAYYRGKATNWESPNSTDVHSLRKVENAAAYVAKYMSKKSDENVESTYEESLKLLTGRLWYCSQSISRLKNAVMPQTYELMGIFKELSRGDVFHVVDDFFEFVGFSMAKINRRISDFLKGILWAHAYSCGYPVPYVKSC